jgi:hypothetical protein
MSGVAPQHKAYVKRFCSGLLGATFTGLDSSINGRKLSNQIGRLVAAVQRSELRRQRREMSAIR